MIALANAPALNGPGKELDLVGKVQVRLLERALRINQQHEEAMEIGQRLRAAIVLRAIPVEGGHRVWLSIMEQPSFTTAEASLGRVSQDHLAELDKLELPSNVALLARCVLAVSLHRNESYREAESHEVKDVTGRPSRSTNGPWRSGRRCWERSTRTWRRH